MLSKPGTKKLHKRAGEAGGRRPPRSVGVTMKERARLVAMTATRSALVPGGSDALLRGMVYNLLTVSGKILEIRRYIAAAVGVSGPQYTILVGIRELQESHGVRVSRLAEYLHVASEFITAEWQKLAALGLVERRADARDRRVTRLCLSRKAEHALLSAMPLIQEINDTLFNFATAADLRATAMAISRIAERSDIVLKTLAHGWRDTSVGISLSATADRMRGTAQHERHELGRSSS